MRVFFCTLFIFALTLSTCFALEVVKGPNSPSDANAIIETTKGVRTFKDCSVEFEIQQKDANVDDLFFGMKADASYTFVKQQLPLNLNAFFPKTGVLYHVNETTPPGLDAPSGHQNSFAGSWYYYLSYDYALYSAYYTNSKSTFKMSWTNSMYFYHYSAGSWTYDGTYYSGARGLSNTASYSYSTQGDYAYCASSSGCRVDYIQTTFDDH